MVRLHLVFVLCLAGCFASGQTWNLADDFSLTANPNGPWAYGSLVSGAFTPAVSTSTGQFNWWTCAQGHGVVGKNVAGYYDYGITQGRVTLEADTDVPAAVWTAPYSGVFDVSVHIGGSTASGPGGYGNYAAYLARLSINDLDQTPDSFVYNVKSWSRTGLLLSAGDKIFASVGQQWGGGNTETNFSVSAVPEPMTFTTILLGSAMLLIGRKRR